MRLANDVWIMHPSHEINFSYSIMSPDCGRGNERSQGMLTSALTWARVSPNHKSDRGPCGSAGQSQRSLNSVGHRVPETTSTSKFSALALRSMGVVARCHCSALVILALDLVTYTSNCALHGGYRATRYPLRSCGIGRFLDCAECEQTHCEKDSEGFALAI